MESLAFLLEPAFQLYSTLIIVRILLVLSGSSPYDHTLQFTRRFVDPLAKHIRRFLPHKHDYVISDSLLLILLSWIKLLLLTLLTQEHWPNPLGHLLAAIPDSLELVFNFLFYMILIAAVLQWVESMAKHPITLSIQRMVDPILRPVRSVIPPIQGIDISPVVVMIGLKLLEVIFLEPWIQFALSASL